MTKPTAYRHLASTIYSLIERLRFAPILFVVFLMLAMIAMSYVVGGNAKAFSNSVALGSPTPTATPTVTPSCTPGAWQTVAPMPLGVYGGAATSDGTVAYVAGGGYGVIQLRIFQ